MLFSPGKNPSGPVGHTQNTPTAANVNGQITKIASNVSYQHQSVSISQPADVFKLVVIGDTVC